MNDRAELSGFLTSRRARLRPAEVGLRDYGRTRRVAGLRREELARLAGVSIAHYTRLEQGRSEQVSDEVLDAIGAALRLDGDELDYLHQLARRPRHCPDPEATPEVSAGVRHLLESMVLTPAVLLGRFTQVIAWNPLAAAVFGDFAAVPEERRTITHLLFTDDRYRELYGAGWESAAHDHVAHLRVLFGRYRGDARVVAHITEMRSSSVEFERLWSSHPVARTRSRTTHLHHPHAGELLLHAELVSLPEAPACCGLDMYAAEPGSNSEAALRNLAA
ncbi:helix-turn-helix domain-containing protein [Nocardia yamanashiensis]|uniref:helix-turn-helix domain-containing protein n=1 Tax=Nocardia yamanashiensis TaxID=209247 RepID=UPI000835BB19|nr:helix-turn-helix transcriptional regulator [Nocardia yamanashiensis]